MRVMPPARRCCSNVSFLEDGEEFKSLLLCLQKSKGLAGITGLVLHLSAPEKRLGRKMRCEICLICASFRTDLRGFWKVG